MSREDDPPRRGSDAPDDIFGFDLSIEDEAPRDPVDEHPIPELEDDPSRAARKRGKKPTRPKREARVLKGETVKRVLVAIPWLIFVVAITILGGLPFAIALLVIGFIGLREYFTMSKDHRPVELAGYIAVAALVIAAHFGTTYTVLLIFCASFPLLFLLGLESRHRAGITNSIGITLIAIVWIGISLAHAVLLRDLPFHGAALLVDVLVGTFVTDTAAYATGRMFGRRKITPRLSPNKTLEGFVGGFVIGMMAVWLAGLYQDWLSGVDALILGAAIAVIAPIGDLFESMLKRDMGTKDTGTLFGPHGGLLDRLDAVFFTVVVGYYVSVWLLY